MTNARARARRRNIILEARQRRRRRAKCRSKRHEAPVHGIASPVALYPHVALTRVTISAPAIFGMVHERPRRELLRFFYDLEQAVLASRPVYIDFRATERMYADGTLLFYAVLDCYREQISRNSLVKCSYPGSGLVEQVLQHVGILDVLGKPHRASVEDDTVTHWRVASGLKVEGEKVASVSQLYRGDMAEPLTQKLYAGITEAMTNCQQHAYPESARDLVEPPAYGRWWMFSQERKGTLDVAFCDLGIGIPASLRTSGRWAQDLIESILSTFGARGSRDGELIRAAFALGRSQTRQRHRGHGLQDIKDVLAAKKGMLWVYSGNGTFRFDSEHGVEAIEQCRQNIPGTMLCWNIPLSP